MISLAKLREHLVGCFEPDFRIVGNTTQREIVQAIDASELRELALRGELDNISAAFGNSREDLNEAGRDIEDLEQKLVAMTAARDEACELAEAATFVIDNGLCERCRNSVCNIEVESIDRIRRVGRDDELKSSLDAPT